MAGNPRENVKDKGFWDGGNPGHNSDGQTAGRTGGSPGARNRRVGIRTDLEFPDPQVIPREDAESPDPPR